MTGLETSSLGLTYLVHAGHLSLMQLLEKMSYNPARLYDFDAGYITLWKDRQISRSLIQVRTGLVSDHFASKSWKFPICG